VYNATVYVYRNGQYESVFVAEVNERGEMLRSNHLQCTGFEGKYLKDGRAAYDVYYRMRFPDRELQIVRDGGEGYKRKIMGLAVPPTYKLA
jgi:hypothetical protein